MDGSIRLSDGERKTLLQAYRGAAHRPPGIGAAVAGGRLVVSEHRRSGICQPDDDP